MMTHHGRAAGRFAPGPGSRHRLRDAPATRIAIVGGLLLSQMLTLFTTPVVYLTLDRFSRRRRGERMGEQAG